MFNLNPVQKSSTHLAQQNLVSYMEKDFCPGSGMVPNLCGNMG